MRKFSSIYLMLILSMCFPVLVQGASDPDDRKGSKEHPLFSRMPDYYIDAYEEKEFDRYSFKGKDGKAIAIEGNLYVITYRVKKGKTQANALQIIRNHNNAVQRIGGEFLFEDANNSYYAIKKDGLATWAHVYARDVGYYRLTIVEKRTMEQDVIADAAQMAREIKDKGKIALYGIYFDTDKSDIKPESKPAIQEIVKFLKENPSIKIYVVGHTDSDGDFAYNERLSAARAQAVVRELTTAHGIAAVRLAGYGVGPLCPVESNRSAAGKAKNRRVELVEQ